MHGCLSSAVRVHLPYLHLLLIHAGGGGPAPVHHSQIQGAALCLQSRGESLGKHASAAGLHQGTLSPHVESIGSCTIWTDGFSVGCKSQETSRYCFKGNSTSLRVTVRNLLQPVDGSSVFLGPFPLKESNLHPNHGTPRARPAQPFPRHGRHPSSAHSGGQAIRDVIVQEVLA